MKDTASINEAFLLEKLGPTPTVRTVAKFLGEGNPTTWRRLKSGQLEAVPGQGIARISLKSLARYLNASEPYRLIYARGKRPGQKKPQKARPKAEVTK